MSCGVSEGKQVIKFANARNHDRICLFSQNEVYRNAKCTFSTSFTSLLFADEDMCGRYCIQKCTNDHFHL